MFFADGAKHTATAGASKKNVSQKTAKQDGSANNDKDANTAEKTQVPTDDDDASSKQKSNAAAKKSSQKEITKKRKLGQTSFTFW